jgi:N-acetylmuramoyl-L-alanine amidase
MFMKIMLDAGHGLQTPGKQAIDGTKEYVFNKMILADVIAQLNRYENVEIHTCHSDARDVPLLERTNLANRLNVDVYVSLHNNAGQASARGTETFVYTTNPPKSRALANRVQANIISLTGMKNRGVKTADFHVLRETNMDAILIEFAFMTNAEDLKLLHSVEFRQKCAIAVANALRDEYGLKLKQGETVATTAVKNGWLQEDGVWHYYQNGVKATGWIKDGGKHYFMGPHGNMHVGWVVWGGHYYYLTNNGAMAVGWHKVDGNWYYLHDDGHLAFNEVIDAKITIAPDGNIKEVK